MNTEEIANLSLMLSIISMIFIFIMWLFTYGLSKKVYNLENIKLNPDLSIWDADVYRTDVDSLLWNISFKIDNSGYGAAKFAKFHWRLYSIYGDQYLSEDWIDVHSKANITSYIPGNSDPIWLSDKLKTYEIKDKTYFKTLEIMMKYTDNRGITWLSKAKFEKSENGKWIVLEESRSFKAKVLKQRHFSKLFSRTIREL